MEQVLTSASWLCSTPCPITQTYSDSFSYQVQSCVAGVHGYSAHVVCFCIDSHTAISRNTEVSCMDIQNYKIPHHKQVLIHSTLHCTNTPLKICLAERSHCCMCTWLQLRMLFLPYQLMFQCKTYLHSRHDAEMNTDYNWGGISTLVLHLS